MAGDSLDEFRAEARAFLDEHAEPVDRSIGRWGEGTDAVGAYQVRDVDHDRAEIERARDWRRTKYDAGFGWISGPRRYGGRELSLQHERAFLDLESRYDVPPQTAFGSGIGIVAPTVLEHGPEWMKDEYLAPIHRGDVITCQFLSEPDAGSDLAAVRTRAERDGDDWVINGQKVWSSNAHHAAVGLLLARTNQEAAKHQGLTTFLLPTHLDGISMRPLRQMTGGAEFNEVFFSEVRLPDRYRLGAVDAGWPVIRTTLGNERAAIGAGGSGYGGAGLAGLLPPERIAQMMRHFGVERDPLLRQGFAQLYTGYELARYTALRTAAAIEAGQTPGPWTATAKLALATHMNRSAGFVAQVLGPRICADSDEWGTYAWLQLLLGVVGMRIGGGTDEILRNTVAEKVLGLPR
ncbi:MAG TPA: acyl-CoA dehydrogenase family protein [Acidimicrobiales bacterium]|nr:acyl-CoA dehydrogenase family protein [Acidimicrobiales bacterium]